MIALRLERGPMRFAPLVLALLAASPAAAMEVPWSLGVRKIHAITVDGPVAYLATGDNRAELVVVEITTGAVLGTFDAPGRADALSVKLLEPGIVKLGRRRSDAPEVYRLDVSDPTAIVVLGTGERERHVRWKPEAIPPVMFPDANGDGVYRLACLGDSNTATVAGVARWCELLAGSLGAGVEVVNVAVSRATVLPNDLVSDATEQLEAVLPQAPDAVIFAFGTNDIAQGRTPLEIVDAYVARAESAASAGVEFFVATTPPMSGCSGASCTRIFATNELLREAFGDRVLEFFDGFDGSHMADNLHLNAAGQALRAERALAVIGSPLLQ